MCKETLIYFFKLRSTRFYVLFGNVYVLYLIIDSRIENLKIC